MIVDMVLYCASLYPPSNTKIICKTFADISWQMTKVLKCFVYKFYLSRTALYAVSDWVTIEETPNKLSHTHHQRDLWTKKKGKTCSDWCHSFLWTILTLKSEIGHYFQFLGYFHRCHQLLCIFFIIIIMCTYILYFWGTIWYYIIYTWLCTHTKKCWKVIMICKGVLYFLYVEFC